MRTRNSKGQFINPLKEGKAAICTNLRIRTDKGWTEPWTKKEGIKVGDIVTVSYVSESGSLSVKDSPNGYRLPTSNFAPYNPVVVVIFRRPDDVPAVMRMLDETEYRWFTDHKPSQWGGKGSTVSKFSGYNTDVLTAKSRAIILLPKTKRIAYVGIGYDGSIKDIINKQTPLVYKGDPVEYVRTKPSVNKAIEEIKRFI